MIKYLPPPLLLLFILIITGCAPVISGPTLSGVERTLKFADIKKDPLGHKGTSVLLGGRVIDVKNHKEISLVEVLHFPLSRSMKPRTDKASDGRFLIRARGFLDPLVYVGKLITVAGPLGAPVTRPLERTEYTYPVIESTEHYLWKVGEYKRPPISFGIGLGISSGF